MSQAYRDVASAPELARGRPAWRLIARTTAKEVTSAQSGVRGLGYPDRR